MGASDGPLREWLALAPPPRPLTGGDAWNVFLSYRSLNRAWVLNLYDVLREQGHRVFIDQVALKPGDPLRRRLEEALESSQAGVLIWASGTADSEWVNNEYDTLLNLSTQKPGFQFVPLVLDKTPLSPFAKNRIYLDFSSYPDGPNGGELLRLLHAVSGVPLSEEAARFATAQDEAAAAANERIAAAIMNGDGDRLMQLARDGGLVWRTSSALACKAAEGLTKLKRNDDAIALLQEIAKRFPRAIRPKQLYALALARRGTGTDLADAQDILATLYAAGERDPETVGIYARTWMDRYEKSHDRRDLERSRDLYAEAFERAPDDFYTGINTAAKSALLQTDEDTARAAEYAQKVQALVGTQARPGNYWMTATVAETFLLQRRLGDAGRMYEAAVAMAPTEIGSQSTTWKQACRLMDAFHLTDEQRAPIRRAFADLDGR